MAFRDILLLVDDHASSTQRTEAAIDLATRSNAHLVGLRLLSVPTVPGFVAAQMPEAVREAQATIDREAAAAARGRFEEAARRAGISYEWRDIAVDTELGAEPISLQARYADLLIVGQPDSEASVDERALTETLLVACGRPVLVIPSIGAPAGFGRRAIVAWDARREAARAVADALPLLIAADEAEVVTVNARPGRGGHGPEPGADIARHLARHGVKVKLAQLSSGPLSVGDLLLNRAADLGADLIVMGAYAHSRLRDLVLGGVTKHMLRHMTVPIFTAH
ncbi:MAG TPA: universal stress protein [Kiloniellales bacterium]|nr:universal stress protein [Kiloniellales bacterium]